MLPSFKVNRNRIPHDGSLLLWGAEFQTLKFPKTKKICSVDDFRASTAFVHVWLHEWAGPTVREIHCTAHISYLVTNAVFNLLLNFFRFFLFFATNNTCCKCNTRYNILLSISCAIAVHHNFDPFLEFGILALLHRRNDFCVREQPCESGRRSYFAFRRFLFLQKEQDFE